MSMRILRPVAVASALALLATACTASGGATGTLLCGIFATAAVSGSSSMPKGISGLIEGHPMQLLTQLYGVAATTLWCGLATWALLRLVGAVFPPRVSPEDEMAGLDISLHGEALQ
jgi:ammonium transporter, Amt family